MKRHYELVVSAAMPVSPTDVAASLRAIADCLDAVKDGNDEPRGIAGPIGAVRYRMIRKSVQR